MQTLQYHQLALPTDAGSSCRHAPLRLDPMPYNYSSSPSSLLPHLEGCAVKIESWCNSSFMRPMKIVDYGYGSEIHWVMKAVNEGLRDGYAVYPTGTLNLAESEEQCGRNHLCYFEPYYWAGCTVSNSVSKESLVSVNTVELAPWVVPPAFSSLGVFEYRALTVAFVHRPNSEMRRRVRRVVDNISFPLGARCIGMHIRRGDSCGDKGQFRECFPNEKYVAAAQRMRLQYDIHCIYLATDDPAAPAAIREAFALLDSNSSSSAKMRIYDGQFDRSPYSKCPDGMCRLGRGKVVYMENEGHLYKGKQGFQLGADMLVDIELLASCVAFVGAFSSNNIRLALELSYARKGVHPPFISLDTSWCWFGFGEFNIIKRAKPMAC